MRLSGRDLRGRPVIAANGQAIGEVAEVFFDSDTWPVESLDIKLHKDIADQLGAARGRFHAGRFSVPVRMIQSAGDAVVLSVPANELRQVA